MALLSHCVRLLGVSLSGCVLALTPGQAIAADCHYEEQSFIINGTVQTHVVEVCTPSAEPVGDVPQDVAPTDSGLDPICVSTAMSNGVDPLAFCDVPPDIAASLLTPGLIAQALATMPLPPSDLKVQPPNGRTLVNFDTNFFTETQPFDRTVTLLGQRVDLHIVPSRFGWQFGDGESLTTAEPGAPYPRLDVTHRYLEKGRVAPSVDTTYTARFRVNGGAWRDVPGSVTIAGPPVALAVLTATPTLVGYN
jgi:hypothetical protein